MRRTLRSRALLGGIALLTLFLVGGGAAVSASASAMPGPSTAETTTTLAAPKSTHAGVKRVLVISIPAISWEDLDLTRLPNLSRSLRPAR